MKKIIKNYKSTIILLVSVIIGTICGLIFKEKTSIVKPLGDLFLNLLLVIAFHLGVAGVAIATVTAQFVSCVLVLRCLYKSDSSYQLRFSKLMIKKYI